MHVNCPGLVGTAPHFSPPSCLSCVLGHVPGSQYRPVSKLPHMRHNSKRRYFWGLGQWACGSTFLSGRVWVAPTHKVSMMGSPHKFRVVPASKVGFILVCPPGKQVKGRPRVWLAVSWDHNVGKNLEATNIWGRIWWLVRWYSGAPQAQEPPPYICVMAYYLTYCFNRVVCLFSIFIWTDWSKVI